jgi:hypothetical protein
MNLLRDFDWNDPANSPICKSKVHGMLCRPKHLFPCLWRCLTINPASGYALQEMDAVVCDAGLPSNDDDNKNIEVSERGEHAQGLTNMWVLAVPNDES